MAVLLAWPRLCRRMRLVALGLLLAALAAPATAGSAADPEVADSADAPATPWADLTAIWLDGLNATHVELHVQVAAVDGPPQGSEVGARLRVGGAFTLVGFTTVPLAGGVYTGGFHCPGQAQGFDAPDTSQCSDLAVTIAGNAYHYSVPLALLGAAPGDAIELVGYSELIAGPDGGLDQAGPGRTFEVPKPAPAPAPSTSTLSATASTAPTAASSPSGPAPSNRTAAAPPLGLALLWAALLARRRA
ncbi:MAG: hypothetical protein ABR586_08950 [Thermoplasmatota archaeon]